MIIYRNRDEMLRNELFYKIKWWKVGGCGKIDL